MLIEYKHSEFTNLRFIDTEIQFFTEQNIYCVDISIFRNEGLAYWCLLIYSRYLESEHRGFSFFVRNSIMRNFEMMKKQIQKNEKLNVLRKTTLCSEIIDNIISEFL